ncbi:segregation/condensation protein A [Candidatus Woesearchaeota archaeon]|nr:segregation/condensation protein A [Candidatus Woesearchaeota archaeon]
MDNISTNQKNTNPQDQVFEIIFDKDDVTWQSILYELVRTEQMDPWDINISLLAQRFLEMLKTLKETDFRISGKIILAAAILLKLKSIKLVGEDISNLDRLFAQTDEEESLLDELQDEPIPKEDTSNFRLIPRMPQPRKRKVSIFDLVDALQKAMEVKKRRVMRDIPTVKVEIPEKKTDISEVIKNMYGKIKNYFIQHQNTKLTFTKLVPSENKEDKVFTFIPLLHLSNQRKIDIFQYQHFGEIEIELFKNKINSELNKELHSS